DFDAAALTVKLPDGAGDMTVKVRLAPAATVGAFDIVLETTGDTARLTLAGRLDALAIPRLRNELANAQAAQPKRLVLLLSGCTTMGDEALRAIVFETEKMNADLSVEVVGASAAIKESMKRAAFSGSVTFSDTYSVAAASR
ncbi:MAG: STAS domain-containing protein, partial [Burkholderiales bacterium]